MPETIEDATIVEGEVLEFQQPLIYGKLIDAARLMGGVAKEGENQAQHFKFRGIEHLTKACAPIFKEVGIVVVPTMDLIQTESLGGKAVRVLVRATYTFYAEDGSSVSATTIGEGADSYDKATNKAMTAAFKYVLLQVLCIGDPDDDGDAAAPPADEPTPARRSRAATRKASPPEPADASSGTNQVSPTLWGQWLGLREKVVADEEAKQRLAEWIGSKPFKADRAMAKADFDELVAYAGSLVSQ